MLDDLEQLDDTTPPAPDAAMLEHVRGQAGRRRARNRLAAAGAGMVALVVVVGAVAVLRDSDKKVDVVGPIPSTTAPTATTPAPDPVSEGTMRNGLHVRMTLETPTVVRGDVIRASVDVRNDTDAAKTIGMGSVECVLNVRPVVQHLNGEGVTGAVNSSCRAIGHTLAPGASISVTTTLATDTVKPGVNYQFGLESYPYLIQPGAFLVIPAIPIQIDAPQLTGHIELAKTRYAAGDTVNGTLVLENQSASGVHYTLGCQGRQPFTMVLAQGAVRFYVPETTIGCVRTNPPQVTLPPGATRLPITVGLSYPSCVTSGPPSIEAPACIDFASPPLAPGEYQIVFEGIGTLAGVDVAPVSIQVTAAPPR